VSQSQPDRGRIEFIVNLVPPSRCGGDCPKTCSEPGHRVRLAPDWSKDGRCATRTGVLQ
jgi:hypothetical protein